MSQLVSGLVFGGLPMLLLLALNAKWWSSSPRSRDDNWTLFWTGMIVYVVVAIVYVVVAVAVLGLATLAHV